MRARGSVKAGVAKAAEADLTADADDVITADVVAAEAVAIAIAAEVAADTRDCQVYS